MKKKMTNGRQTADTNILRAAIVIGSIFGTLVGGEALAISGIRQEAAVSQPAIVVQQADGSQWLISKTDVAQLIVPAPLTESRSSN